MNKIGRRISLAGSLFLCGITCIAGAFVTDGKKIIENVVLNH